MYIVVSGNVVSTSVHGIIHLYHNNCQLCVV